ncbi:MAG: DUF4040 domain-containing protein [Defluviitaleaceae bacterium]|nr:DUF4040 domain-containing protein [Defluviitaleaceae bacterium]
MINILYIMLFLWMLSGVLVLIEKKVLSMIIWFFIFSLVGAFAFFLLGSPDVAMAEAAIGAFSTIVFIVCFEKFFKLRDIIQIKAEEEEIKKENKIKRFIIPCIFVLILGSMFIYFLPPETTNSYLKELYITRFMSDIGGENAVTSIYLGYRLYDTLFEALMLVIAVVAITHMSYTDKIQIKEGERSEIEKSNIANLLLRALAPMAILFGIYVIANGFLTAGGGFQGGLAIASFFICRFLIYDVYDLDMKKINKLEELVFILIVVVAAVTVFQGTLYLFPEQYTAMTRNIYLIFMNALVGLKVACGFIILFYRYVAIERN